MNTLEKDRIAEQGYRLIDFGEGRKLESFAGKRLDRPSPAAEGTRKRSPDQWANADSVFHSETKRWKHQTGWAEPLTISCGSFSMPIAPTPFGHVGLFPEQMLNWQWLAKTSPAVVESEDIPDPHATPYAGLNLFGYTGASSIAMAVSGMNVAHVDAAKPNVSAAKSAAAMNGLSKHPIRYLVDDAAKFAAREVRRGNQYHTIVMDPPAYGHSPKGQTWRLERDLWPLIDSCLSILNPNRFRLLITGHSPQVQSNDVVDYLRSRIPRVTGASTKDFDQSVQSGRLSLTDATNRKLDAGFFVRCCQLPL